jgi:hypothetical protein
MFQHYSPFPSFFPFIYGFFLDLFQAGEEQPDEESSVEIANGPIEEESSTKSNVLERDMIIANTQPIIS